MPVLIDLLKRLEVSWEGEEVAQAGERKGKNLVGEEDGKFEGGCSGRPVGQPAGTIDLLLSGETHSGKPARLHRTHGMAAAAALPAGA